MKKNYWRIIVLQYCVGFYHTTTRISHNYVYIFTLPLESPSHPHLMVGGTGRVSLIYVNNLIQDSQAVGA